MGKVLHNGIRIGYQPGETEENNVIFYLETHLQNFPDRTALKWVSSEDVKSFSGAIDTPFMHHHISYSQFAEGIENCAKGLQDLGIGKGDRVIIFLPMSVLMYTAMFAVQRLGAIAVFLDSWARRNHLGASAACVEPKAMISHKMAFELIAQIPEFSSMQHKIIAGPGFEQSYSAQLEVLANTPGQVPVCPVASEHTALITFTTGSSGTPKGANRTHRFLSAQHEALSDVVPYTTEDSDMPAFPIFSLNNLASGVTTILPAIDLAQPSNNDAAAIVNQLIHGKISCSTLSPSMLDGVSQYCIQNKLVLSSLRRVVTGGAPISKDNVRDFKSIAPDSDVWVLYGSTEVEPMAHIEAREMLSLPENPDLEIVEEGVNVGHISEDLEYKFIKIVKEPIDFQAGMWSDLEVAKGQVGEFIVTGDHVCRDYYNNTEAFRKAKIKDDQGRIWHRTGDLARIDDEGYLWMVGRIHNVITRGDEYFFPVRAEIILRRLDFVSQAAFLAMPDKKLVEANALVIQLRDSSAGLSEKNKQEIMRLFSKNSIPIDYLYVVDSIPMDPRHHSKVEYEILRSNILETRLESKI